MTASLVQATIDLIDADSPGAVSTVIAGRDFGAKAVFDASGTVVEGTVPEHLHQDIHHDVIELIRRERTVTLGYGEEEVFFEVLAPRPVLFVFGAVHIAQELVAHASLLGFRVVVADPRPAFVTPDRFPDAHELRIGWPSEVCDPQTIDQRTFVVVLTHDRRFEDPLWPIVLPSPARYIGAMGSAKTTAKRRARLLGEGFAEAVVDRIHGPIGLEIGARTAGETAIAIIGEMISARYSADEPLDLIGEPLRA